MRKVVGGFGEKRRIVCDSVIEFSGANLWEIPQAPVLSPSPSIPIRIFHGNWRDGPAKSLKSIQLLDNLWGILRDMSCFCHSRYQQLGRMYCTINKLFLFFLYCFGDCENIMDVTTVFLVRTFFPFRRVHYSDTGP